MFGRCELLWSQNICAMRIRSKEQPASAGEIERIIEFGARSGERESRKRLLERLECSCYLAKGQPERALKARDRLLAQYQKDGLVLFLGAGVSLGSGIPSWNSLIEDVLQQVGIGDYDTVKRAFPSLLTQFELAGLRAGGQKAFAEILYDCLYEQPGFKHLKSLLKSIPRGREEQPKWSQWDDLRKELAKNETLRDVGDLLVLDDSEKRTLMRNPQIHAVLTVNADNLLELYCLAKTSGKHRLVTMVDRASVGDHPDATPVYHLHGTLDARDENFRRTDSPCVGDNLQEITDDLLPRLVFRESEYYETIAKPASFVNHTPQSYFQRLNVLFIGTSLDDLNIRRWLYSSFQERVEQRTKYLRELHWKFYKDAKSEAKLESVRHFWLRSKKEEAISCERAKWVDLVMSELGVQVVWCDDLCDMRRCIRELRENGRVPEFGRRAVPR